jgi:hypothetical protein
MGRRRLIVKGRGEVRPSDVADWLTRNRVKVLNLAGNWERKAPGICEHIERFLLAVFDRLGDPASKALDRPK